MGHLRREKSYRVVQRDILRGFIRWVVECMRGPVDPILNLCHLSAEVNREQWKLPTKRPNVRPSGTWRCRDEAGPSEELNITSLTDGSTVAGALDNDGTATRRLQMRIPRRTERISFFVSSMSLLPRSAKILAVKLTI